MTTYALVLRPVLRWKPKPSGDYMNRKELFKMSTTYSKIIEIGEVAVFLVTTFSIF